MTAGIARHVQIDARMWVEVAPGGECRVHPGGGLVISEPGRRPCWVRMEGASFKRDEMPARATVVRVRDQPRPD